MKRDDLPQDIRQFLDACIDSIEQLQVLLLLNSNPDRSWSTTEIATELRSVDTAIEKRMADLYQRNILERKVELHDRHQFTPSSDRMRELVQGLAHQNQVRPYQVIDAIYSGPSKSIRDFADAFKVRGDKS